MDKPAEDRSVTVLKGVVKKPKTQVSVDSMDPIRATPPDYLAQATVLAEDVFEDKAVAASWMATAKNSHFALRDGDRHSPGVQDIACD